MIDISKGRYWDDGIKLVSRCTPCSPGCDNCWALAMEKRFEAQHDIARMKFIGVHPERLKRFNTCKPKVFAIWNDLFHEGVPFDFQLITYFFIATYSKNTYLILTKRPHNMLNYLQGTTLSDTVWHGLTVCNQQEADEKIPIFLQVPGKKFLSIEPMLGKIEDIFIPHFEMEKVNHYPGFETKHAHYPAKEINAVILGGETGAGARPLHPDWVRSVRDQCAAVGVPFFFKKWGNYWKTLPGIYPEDDPKGRTLDGRTHDELPWVQKYK